MAPVPTPDHKFIYARFPVEPGSPQTAKSVEDGGDPGPQVACGRRFQLEKTSLNSILRPVFSVCRFLSQDLFGVADHPASSIQSNKLHIDGLGDFNGAATL